MPLKGYGDDYGDRYAQVYSVEVLTATGTGSLSGTETGRATESGTILTTVVPTLSEFGRTSESGRVSASGVLAGTELAKAVESGAIDVGATQSLTELTRALESGAVSATIQPAIESFSRVFESGSIDGTATFRFNPLVFTDSDDPVDAFKIILQEVRSQAYALSRPDVFAMWEVDPQQRLKKPDPAVYVWSPTAGSLDRFSADGDLTTDSRTVELMVMTYSASATHRYTENIIDIVGDYVDDNAQLTVYEDVDVDTVADERGDHIFGESDHYINTIEISTSRLRTTNNV